MNFLYVYSDAPSEWNCSRWNCGIPSETINRIGKHQADTLYIEEFSKNTEKAQELGRKADIIIVERNYFGDTSTMVQYWKIRNKTIIGVFDDGYHVMHPENPTYPFWKYGEVTVRDQLGNERLAYMRPHPLDQFVWTLKLFKAIHVPSVTLVKDWSKYAKAYHVHNFLNISQYENIKPLLPKVDGEIVIGWCGSLSHHASFANSGVVKALISISKKYPNVKILIGGDKRVFNLIESKNKIFQKHVPDEQWTALLKSIDIGLAPLHGEYDKRRSWIKALEYMALQIPWVASDFITYDELKPFGLITKNGVKNWTNALSEMIENYSQYKKLAETDGYDFAQSQSSDKKVEEVTIPLYEKLINEPYPDNIAIVD